MIYLLLILFPGSMAVASFLLRKQPGLTVLLGVATAIAEMAMVLLLPADRPARLLGLIVTFDPIGRLFLLELLGIAMIAFLGTLRVPHGENFTPVTLLTIGLTTAILLLQQEPFTVTLLLVSVGVIAVLAIVDLPVGSSALVGRAVIATALKYLVLMVVAGVVMYMAFVLITIYQPGQALGRVSPARLTLALLVVGFGLRLAILPFHSWLPDLLEHAAPMVAVVVVNLINATSVIFLITALQLYPIIVFENDRGMGLLMILGALTAILGGGLALAQENMRRQVGYLLVYNAGMILFGLATSSSNGLAASIYEIFSQSLAVTLLLLSIALLERPDGRPANVLRRDLIWRWPIASIGLLGGGMALLGIPPMSGFAGKLLLYQAAADAGGPYLAALLISTGLAALALTRLARERLFGAPEEVVQENYVEIFGQTELDRPVVRRLDPEPRELAALTILLLIICLGIGLYPQILLNTIQEVVRGMPFIKI